jgi:bifunctional oligoribonuclease and PAP phosphatase NrnA
VQEAFNLIKNSSHILFASHVNPDADTLGSSLGMMHAITSLNKKTTVYNCSEIPASLGFLPGIEKITNIFPNDVDLVIALDCGNIKRLGLVDGSYKILNIDHHASNPMYGDENIVISSAASAGSVVLKFLEEFDFEINKDSATCLYAALASDTGFFQYESTDENVFLDAAYLAKCGADAAFIAQQLTQKEPLSKIKLLSEILQTLKIMGDGKMASLYMTQEMLTKCAAKNDEADGAVELARSIDGVEVSLFLREEKGGKIRGSLRSKNFTDVNALAALFGGGGHVKAAGFTIESDTEFALKAAEIAQKIETEITRGTY